MRRTLILLTPLLLAGCISESTSYMISDRDHAVTLRAEQKYFWKDEVEVRMIISRLPDCQRQLPLASLRASNLEVELFDSGDNVFALRSAGRVWRVETQTCTQLPDETEEHSH